MADLSTGHAVRVAFRTDAGSAVGLGHLRRCLALAHALRAVGAESLMLLDGDHRALELAMAAGLEASAVARADDPGATVEWCGRLGAAALVVDSYGFLPDDLGALVAAGRPVVVFDDTANRKLPVDLVINGGAGAGRLPYRGAPHTRYLLGPRYLALRPEFAEAAPRTIHDHVQRALVTIGGADPGRLTAPPRPLGDRRARRHHPLRGGGAARRRPRGDPAGPRAPGPPTAAPMRSRFSTGSPRGSVPHESPPCRGRVRVSKRPGLHRRGGTGPLGWSRKGGARSGGIVPRRMVIVPAEPGRACG